MSEIINSSRGVHKVSEKIFQDKRAIITTDTSAIATDYPDGSLLINPNTGIILVKLKDASEWAPFGTKNDGTISIAKDAIINTEIFTIENPKLRDGVFTYLNSKGQRREMPFTNEGYVFELEDGIYQPGRNHLRITIDSVLERTSFDGAISELTQTRFRLNEKIVAGQEIKVQYFATIRIGNPYPRVFIKDGDIDSDPKRKTAEIGDLYLDTSIGDNSSQITAQNKDGISWSMIKNTPTTLSGYGISDKVAAAKHSHLFSEDIIGAPQSLPANGGNADTAVKLRNAFSVIVNGEASGSTMIDGSRDVNLNLSLSKNFINREDVRNEISAIALAATASSNAPSVSGRQVTAISGILAVSTGGTYTLPIPNGYARNQCYYMVSPTKITAGVAVNFYLDTSSGNISAVTGITQMSYTVIGIK